MWKTLKTFGAAKDGATAIEYAIIAGGIAPAIRGTVNAPGLTVLSKYQSAPASFG